MRRPPASGPTTHSSTSASAAPDGIVVVDACPAREDWEAVIVSPQTAALLTRHGLPVSEVTAPPVHAAHVTAQPMLA